MPHFLRDYTDVSCLRLPEAGISYNSSAKVERCYYGISSAFTGPVIAGEGTSYCWMLRILYGRPVVSKKPHISMLTRSREAFLGISLFSRKAK